jgi:hypothetical protein
MKLKWLLPLLLALAVLGCASGPGKIDPKDESLSVVYGYFDMADAPSSLDWVFIKQYGNNKDEGYRVGAKEGLWLHVGIEPGSYQVATFGGVGGIPLLTRRDFRYDFGSKGRNSTALRITKPGVYFFGSHRYINHAGKGFFSPDKFEMRASKTPSEKEVLKMVIHQLETDKDLAEYTRALRLAKQKLAAL